MLDSSLPTIWTMRDSRSGSSLPVHRVARDAANVGFFYTHACPLRCNFCCHTAEVVGPGRFVPSRLVEIITDFARQPSVARFFFSGGDPFVYFDEIRAIISAAREAGVRQPMHLVTAGYWARSDAETTDLLAALHACGVDLHVSYDTEHARFVPAANIHRIAEVCARLGMTLKVFGTFWDQTERVEDLLPVFPGVTMQSALVAPVGAARAKFAGRRYDLDDQTKYSCGGARVYDVGVYPNGDAYPCCSGGFNKEARLACGNVFDDDAATILGHVYQFFHARLAKEIGFDTLYARIRARRPDLLPRLRQFADVDSACEICVSLRASPALTAELSGVYDELQDIFHAPARPWPGAVQHTSDPGGANHG